jgi:hypothetical protein
VKPVLTADNSARRRCRRCWRWKSICRAAPSITNSDAHAAGEAGQRLYALDAWRGTPFFDDRERAALAWIEAVTLVSQGHVPDAVDQGARQHAS